MDFFKNVNIGITICDNEGTIVYMNNCSRSIFGNKTGQSMLPCHNAHSQEIIHRLLDNVETNVYTIQKGDIKKLIYQTPWYQDDKIAGLVEFSIVLPVEIPHYVR